MALVDYKSKFGKKLRLATLCFLLTEKTILLAMKKRGFGAGKVNGLGGKVKEGETVSVAVKREVLEEVGVHVQKLQRVAVLDFYFSDQSDWNQRVFVFIAHKWKGDPVESEEMKPAWYDLTEIPYDNMWIDDQYWLPKVLAGQKVKAAFLLDSGGKELEHEVFQDLSK